MTAPILIARGVGKQFGNFTALNNVSVSFERGRLTAIIGPNGAGKSTFFNLLSGAFAPTAGRIIFDGHDITGSPQHAFARMGIAKSFQITNVFPQRARLPEPIGRADALLEQVGLIQACARPARDLAHGEQRCLEVAMALACEPRLLLLDEPTAGMSPEETTSMMNLIVKLAAERTVILVEHKMKLVMGICERLIVLHHGELLADGTPDAIRNNDEVKRVYLGQGIRC